MTTNPDPLKEWRETLADLLAKCVLDRVERDGALHRSSLADEISLGLFRASVVPNAHGEPASPIEWGQVELPASYMFEPPTAMDILGLARDALNAAPVSSRMAEVIDLGDFKIPRGIWKIYDQVGANITRTWLAMSDGVSPRLEEIVNDMEMKILGEIFVTEKVSEGMQLVVNGHRYGIGLMPVPPLFPKPDHPAYSYSMPWTPQRVSTFFIKNEAEKPFSGGKLIGSLNVSDLKNDYLGSYFKSGWHDLQIPESARIVYITEDGMIWDAGENTFTAAYDPNRTPKVVKINQRWFYYPMNGNKAFNAEVSVLLNGTGSGEVLGPITGKDKDMRDSLMADYQKAKGG